MTDSDKEVFFGRVEHDLRGELATMLAGVHYLMRYESGLSPTARQMLERVHGAGDRLRKLLGEFGHAVWLEAEPNRAVPHAAFDLQGALEAVAGALGPKAEGRGVELRIDVPEGIEQVFGDEDLVRTALGYAAELAIIRSKDRPVVLACRIEDGWGVVRIVDEAGALDEALCSRLLEPFGEKDIVPKDPGSRRERLGLGLPIARSMLRAHGGDLAVEPSPSGEGVCLRLVLAPVREKNRDATRAA